MTVPPDTPPDAYWHAALGQGRFLLQRARATAQVIFPPRVAAPGTGDTDLEWFEPPGGGTVYSVTIIHPKPPAPPYHVALIDLDARPRVMSRVEGVQASAVSIGQRVIARVLLGNEGGLLVFDPA